MESHKLNGPDDFFLKKCIIANLNIFFTQTNSKPLYTFLYRARLFALPLALVIDLCLLFFGSSY